jgi:hypothetical protein
VQAIKSQRITLDHNLFFALNTAFRFDQCDGFRIINNTTVRIFHRVGAIVHSGNGYLRNNSFALGSSYLLHLHVSDEQLKSFDSDYNNFAVYLRQDTRGKAPPDEILMPEQHDFYYGESKSMVLLDGPNNSLIPIPTLAAWRERTGQDRHSIFAHPRYADPKHRDFRILPSSPNIGAGENRANIGALGVAQN